MEKETVIEPKEPVKRNGKETVNEMVFTFLFAMYSKKLHQETQPVRD